MATKNEKINAWMQIGISFILLVAGIVVLTSPNYFIDHAISEGTQKIAAGWIGAIIGYWLS